MKQIKNQLKKMKKNDKIILIMGFYTIVMILLASFVWDVMTPKQPVSFNPVTFLIICLGLSFVFHGFNPILLFKGNSNKNVEIKRRE